MVRGHTVLPGCMLLSHKNLSLTANTLLLRLVENETRPTTDIQNQALLNAVLENQCKSAAQYIYPGTSVGNSIVVPKCIPDWQKWRSNWSELGKT